MQLLEGDADLATGEVGAEAEVRATDPQLLPFLTWTYDDNRTGWGALLGDSSGGGDVSPYATPARASDLTGLPDTYVRISGRGAHRGRSTTGDTSESGVQ